MKKVSLFLIILIILALTTGCWDMVEINQRIFPYSIGIDLNPEEGEEYIITTSYLNINGIGKNATQEERVFIVSTPASSIYEAMKRLGTVVAYPIYLKHLRVIVFGEELAKDEQHIREIVDGLSRDFIINKKLRIATAEGRAKDILDAIPKAVKQEEIEGSLFALLKDNKETSRYTSKTLTGFIQGMDIGEVVIPRIKIEEEDIKVFGGSIFKNYRCIGNIDELQSRVIAFIRDDGNLELIDLPYKEKMISYEILGTRVKKDLETSGKDLVMKIDMEVEGALQQYVLMDEIDTNGEEELESMEGEIKKAIEKDVNKMIYLLQREYKSDLLGIGEYISKFHPRVWKEVSKDWEEIYQEMKIDVVVDPKIRRRGLIK